MNGAGVPEAAIHEYDDLRPREYDLALRPEVRFRPVVDSLPQPLMIDAASNWLDGHPEPDVPAMLATADPDEPAGDLDRRITETLERHSLDLASAAGTNPSLTLGSTTALHDRVIDEILDLVLSCQVDEIERLTDVAIDLLLRMPTSVRAVGDAVFHLLGDPTLVLPPMSV